MPIWVAALLGPLLGLVVVVCGASLSI
jgi:hypothetical protein